MAGPDLAWVQYGYHTWDPAGLFVGPKGRGLFVVVTYGSHMGPICAAHAHKPTINVHGTHMGVLCGKLPKGESKRPKLVFH